MTRIQAKEALTLFFNAVAAVGTIILVFSIFRVLNQQRDQIEAQRQQILSAQQQTQRTISELEKNQQTGDQEILSILRCQLVLFGKNRSAPVSEDQLNACLNGTPYTVATPAPTAHTASPTTSPTPTVTPGPQSSTSKANQAPETGSTSSTKPPVSTSEPPPTVFQRLGGILDITKRAILSL